MQAYKKVFYKWWRQRYICDNSLLDENDKCKGNLLLNNILRSYDVTKYPITTSKDLSPSKFEKKLINRIFYGKSSDVKDRQMSPKVKFWKKEKNVNNTENSFFDENEKNKTFMEIRNGKKFENENIKIDKHNDSYNVCNTENNEVNSNYNTGTGFNSLYKLKKSPRKYKPEFGQNDNFADTVKKNIFI